MFLNPNRRDLRVAADLRFVGVSLREAPRLSRGADSEMLLHSDIGLHHAPGVLQTNANRARTSYGSGTSQLIGFPAFQWFSSGAAAPGVSRALVAKT